jgi:hypothetical protein
VIGIIIPQAQAAISSATIVTNMIKGLAGASLSWSKGLTYLSKDIGGFEFDYIGDQRLEAGNDITDHFTEENFFMQDHCGLRPTLITCKGFVSETVFKKKNILGMLGTLQSALSTVQPYVRKYSPGTSSKMLQVTSQVDTLVNQLSSIAAAGVGASKLIKSIRSIALPTTCEEAYVALDDMRQQQCTFAVVTPFKVFKNMLIENMVLVAPEHSRDWTDITVRLKEIRTVPLLAVKTMDNARVPGLSAP